MLQRPQSGRGNLLGYSNPTPFFPAKAPRGANSLHFQCFVGFVGLAVLFLTSGRTGKKKPHVGDAGRKPIH